MGMTRMASVDYLIRHVARGDGRQADPSSPLTRYYTAQGYPPGRWLGSGLAGLAGDVMVAGAEVTEAQMRALFEHAQDPTSGARLGSQTPPKYRTRAERIAHRIAALPGTIPPADRAKIIDAIHLEERQRPVHRAVAGFDLTFSVPKSVSALWAVADHGVQAKLYEAHHAALRAVLTLIEDEAAFTRSGTDGVIQLRTRGLIAAAHDHWDSRDGDPQLHTHVTVPNRVQGEDGIWRTLDSRAMYRATVAYSETYRVFLADEVTARTGLTWDLRERGRGRRPARELARVPEALITEFSGRTATIDPLVDAAVDTYVASHGRRPNSAVLAKIRQSITLDTRTAKHAINLAEATIAWRERAATILRRDPGLWARTLTQPAAVGPVLLRVDDIPPVDIAALGASVVHQVSSARSTWTRWNLTAEAMRQIGQQGWQMVDTDERTALRDLIVTDAEALSVSISPPELAHVPDPLRHPDGTSRFAAPRHFTSRHVLAAEDHLLALAGTITGPAVAPDRAHNVAEQHLPGKTYALAVDDQAPAAITIATSGRVVDVLIGPAGTGKTTSMAGVRAIWESTYGPGSVLGLAPSAKAAQVLGADLGVITDNTAQWIAQQQIQRQRAALLDGMRNARAEQAATGRSTARLDTSIATAQALHDRWRLQPGQLLIVDEAGMAGTFALDTLATQAAESGAKLLLVGDPHQLSAIETGGAFGLLTAQRPDTPTLTEVRRFTNPDGTRRRWEERAAAGLRVGDETVLATYGDQARIISGDSEDMLTAAYAAWQADTATGAQSLLIAADNNTVHTLNERARTDLVAAGTVDDRTTTPLLDGLRVGRGDRVVTREIDRFLADGTGAGDTGRTGRRTDGFVRNGQQWHVAQVNRDGSIIVQLLDSGNHASAARVCLPAEYVSQHVDLAYATTCHRAQGMTVDSAYTVVTAGMTRETLYVAMTRGRSTNQMMVSLDPPLVGDVHSHQHDEDWTEAEVLHAILSQTGAQASAHEAIATELDTAGSIAQLAAEYESIAAIAHEDRLAALLDGCVGTATTTRLLTDPDFAELNRAVRAATVAGTDIANQLRDLVPAALPAGAADLTDRVRNWTTAVTAGQPRVPRHFIAGVVAHSENGITDPSMRRALSERAQLIEARADTVLDLAIENHARWLADMPPAPPPGDPAQAAWRQTARQVAAYRDRWKVTTTTAMGLQPGTGSGHSRQGDYRRINAVLQSARAANSTAKTTAWIDTVTARRGRDR